MKDIPDPTSPPNAPQTKKQTEAELKGDDKKRFKANIDTMNMIIPRIPNDIYNSVDACQTAKAIWNLVQRLMQGTDLSQQERDSRLMNEFDKFSAKAGDSIGSVYEKISRLVNNMKRNKVLQSNIAINTKIVRNQGNNVGNSFVQKFFGNTDNVQRSPRTTTNSRKRPTIQCYNCNEKFHYARECSKPRVCDSKIFREHMLLATKDKAGINLDDEENDFMLMNAFGDEKLEELNASVIMMAHIQPADYDSNAEPTYDSDFVSEPTYVDDQIDSNIIFDSPYMEVNGVQVELAYDAHDQKLDAFKSMIKNV
ncbi:polynucleotide 5'-hydroxyl-kinase NOL9 [Tanacetum coccineum]